MLLRLLVLDQLQAIVPMYDHSQASIHFSQLVSGRTVL